MEEQIDSPKRRRLKFYEDIDSSELPKYSFDELVLIVNDLTELTKQLMENQVKMEAENRVLRDKISAIESRLEQIDMDIRKLESTK